MMARASLPPESSNDASDLETALAQWRAAKQAYDAAELAQRSRAVHSTRAMVAAVADVVAARQGVMAAPAHGVRQVLQKLEFILQDNDCGDPGVPRVLTQLKDIVAQLQSAIGDSRFVEPAALNDPAGGNVIRIASMLANLELVQIGRQLDRLFPDLLARIEGQHDRIEMAHKAAHREFLDWSAVPIRERPGIVRRHEEALGVYDPHIDPEVTSFRIMALSERASRLRATSAEALRTKARLVNWTDGPFRAPSVLASLIEDLGGADLQEAADASPTPHG